MTLDLDNPQEKELLLYPAFKENNFTVAFASDNNFVKYLSVAILSLIENCSNKYNYDIVILDSNISNKNKRLLHKEVSDYKNVSLRFVDVQRFYDENKDIEFSITKNYTIAIYNRLFIPEIFKNYYKVLYLDCDIVVKGDLSDLYEIDLENNYIGAIVDMGALAWKTEDSNSDAFYKYKEINSGVILYNIKECLKNNFTEKCLDNIKIDDNILDQTAINITCRDNIKYIDYRYNFFASVLDDTENIKDIIPKYILDDIRIIHFTGAKCWFRDFTHNSNADWFYYFTKTPFFNLFTLIVLKFELFRYKICIKVTRNEKQKKYVRKVKVLGEIVGRIDIKK